MTAPDSPETGGAARRDANRPATGPADEPAGSATWNAASAYTAEEALAMDAWLVAERGCSIAELMAVAGARVAEAARELLRERGLSRVVFLVGPGNNGGDALVAERLLRAEVETHLWRPLPRPRAADALAGVGAVGTLPPRAVAALPPLDARTLLVDGLFGVGLRRPLDGAARAAVERVNASDATVLAIDIPSGLHATTGEVVRGVAIRADVTLTFVGPKRGFFLGSGPAFVGSWRAVDIGFPPQLAHDWLARRRAAEPTP